ncbi:MAG: T9SS type A sorting domain-containing protein [Bacteroidota bacterium]|nr:T9SS type A sorting domain-containing protein [Bacteroidota bacterium]
MNQTILSIFLFLAYFFKVSAGEPAIGHWRDHLNYSQAFAVAEGGGKVYCAAQLSLFSYDKADGSIQRLSKINGLSDIGFETIAYNKKSEALLIVYSNSNLDILKGNRIINLADIRRSNVLGDKRIYGVTFKEDLAYLATGFGIVVVDMSKEEIKDTYYYRKAGSIKTNKVIVDNTYLYAATDSGIFQAKLNSPNLSDFNSWSKRIDLPDTSASYKSMALLNDSILVIVKASTTFNNDSIFYFKDNNWQYFDKGDNHTVYSIETHKNLLLITNYNGSAVFNLDGQREFFISDYYTDIQVNPKHMIRDEQDIYWIADFGQGLIRVKDNEDFSLIKPKGPASNNINHLAASKNDVWIAAGSRSDSWASTYSVDDISILSDQEWNILPPFALDGNKVFDVLNITVNPQNSKQVFASTWSKGLLEITNQSISNVYSSENSTLENLYLDPNFYKVNISSSAYDKDNNIWVTNWGAYKPLSVKKADGTWKSFEIPGKVVGDFIGQVIISQSNHKWIVYPRGGGILVYDDNNTIDDPSDDRTVTLTAETGKGGLPSNSINSIASDHDGKIWVGTENGVAVFFNPEAVFGEGNFDAQQIKIQQEGNIQLLLEKETVSAITIDGANRKWFGTLDGGVYLMSADGTQQIESFNINNSPLFSNSVRAITITNDGEVFFGTDRGLISYRGTASEGVTSFNKVYAYPNPVRPDYEGVIAIKGLVKDVDVKITDISGNLVYETKALGGQAIWDGKTLRGTKARSGIYLVFCSDQDGEKTIVTKILVAN